MFIKEFLCHAFMVVCRLRSCARSAIKLGGRFSVKRTFGVKVMLLVELFVALGGISAGINLLTDHSGGYLGLETVLHYISFLQDLTLVDVWLTTVYGVLPLILAVGLWMLACTKRWAWFVALVLGAVLIVWILTEVVIFYSLGFTFLYPLYAVIGALTIGVLCLPSVRRYYAKP